VKAGNQRIETLDEPRRDDIDESGDVAAVLALDPHARPSRARARGK
jgi:hypothetical protein